MQPIEVGKAYDTLTHLWESEKFNLDNGIEAHQRALQFAKETGAGLDVGCGLTGRFSQLLLDKGYEVDGVDVSEQMIEKAKQKLPKVRYFHADVCQWALPTRYDFISAWDCLWHVPLNQQRSLMEKLVAGLNPGGVMILSFGATDEPGEHVDSTMGPEMYYSSLGTNELLLLLMELGCECLHVERDQVPELHCYLIVRKKAE